MLYKKSEIRTYSAGDLFEIIGSCQTQYTPTPPPTQYTATLYTTTGNSSVNVDGYVLSDGNLFINTFYVGDTEFNMGDRGFVGFNISDIPQGSTIISATLRVYQAASHKDSVWGEDPYGVLGTIVIDHVNFGSSMDASDYSSAALTSNIGTISNNVTYKWKTLDVKSYVQTDLDAGRISSQYRLRFTTETNNNYLVDNAGFEDAENSRSTGNRPELVVIYQ